MSLKIDFKRLVEDNLSMLSEWLNRPHLQEWWREGEISPGSVREKYLPRIIGKDTAVPFMVYRESEAIGYIQYYDASAGDPNWWPDNPRPGVLGIDQFLANNADLGKGLGTIMIRKFIEKLKKEHPVTEIRVDPRPDNLRAIRCYKKVGFREAGLIKTPDGPALMMVLKI